MADASSFPQLSREAVHEAARWALRIESGLSPDEERQLADWLAIDARHAAALAEHRQAWARFEPLANLTLTPPGVVREAPRVTERRKPQPLRLALPLAVAAAVAIGFVLRNSPSSDVAEANPAPDIAFLPLPCEHRLLADGSEVDLNRGARVREVFSPTERRVQLLEGEATFSVSTDPARPFVVDARGMEVRALGTVFNVRLSGSSASVLVTEGAVQVVRSAVNQPNAGPAGVVVRVGEQVVMPHDGGSAIASTLSPEEIERELAWQPRMLEFDDVPLSAITRTFNERNPVRLVIDDPQLAAMRMTASLRSDNVAGFVRLLGASYSVTAERSQAGDLLLRRK